MQYKKFSVLASVCLLTSCNLGTANKNLEILVPFMSEKNTYVYNLSINETKNKVKIPLQFNEAASISEIKNVLLVNKEGKNISINNFSLENGDNGCVFLVIENEKLQDSKQVIVNLLNEKQYKFNLLLEEVKVEKTNDVELEFKYFDTLESSKLGNKYYLEYTLKVNNILSFKGFSEKMKNSPLSHASYKIFETIGKKEYIAPFLQVGTYDFTLTLNEDPYIYYFNENIILNFGDDNGKIFETYLNNSENTILNKLFDSYKI